MQKALILEVVGDVKHSSEETEKAPAFSEVFNARCEELGLLSAPEIAQRIISIQPTAANVDLARSVRNWQAGRNVPRSDFYRIILTALDIDEEMARTVWHRAYAESKAKARASFAGGAASSGVTADQGARREDDAPEGEMSSAIGDGAEGQGTSRRRPPIRFRTRWAAATAIAGALLAAGAALGLDSNADEFGPLCDASAGARWDPERNGDIPPVNLQDIRASAIEACEGAVRESPMTGRYWFQLGRAYDRDAKWHGNYAEAYEAFRRAHELDHAAAALSLGMLLEDGHTGKGGAGAREPDLREAASFYELAAEKGLPMGHYCHAIATLFGWSGKPPAPSEAIRSAQAAVAAGSHRAVDLFADLREKRPRTRHVECSREFGVEFPPKSIVWGHEADSPA